LTLLLSQLLDAAAIMDDICVTFQWQAGDLLLLDNRLVMHSRQPFSGPRKILASLVRDPER
jgi:alpha-ketoglutarate-dependent taurine dioxygenase